MQFIFDKESMGRQNMLLMQEHIFSKAGRSIYYRRAIFGKGGNFCTTIYLVKRAGAYFTGGQFLVKEAIFGKGGQFL